MSNVSGIGAPTPEPIQPREIQPDSPTKQALQNTIETLKTLTSYATEHQGTVTEKQAKNFLDQLEQLPKELQEKTEGLKERFQNSIRKEGALCQVDFASLDNLASELNAIYLEASS